MHRMGKNKNPHRREARPGQEERFSTHETIIFYRNKSGNHEAISARKNSDLELLMLLTLIARRCITSSAVT